MNYTLESFFPKSVIDALDNGKCMTKTFYTERGFSKEFPNWMWFDEHRPFKRMVEPLLIENGYTVNLELKNEDMTVYLIFKEQ